MLLFEDRSDGRIDIVGLASLERIHPQPKRAHQGWRYLAGSDAPKGISEDDGLAVLPPELHPALAELRLISQSARTLSARALAQYSHLPPGSVSSWKRGSGPARAKRSKPVEIEGTT